MARGPAYFKWTVGRLIPTTMVEIIEEIFSDEAAVLKKHVRGIRPRVGALANPREGEPKEYVLVLADIIKAIDKDNVVKYPYRLARYKYDKDKLNKYQSACMCTIQNQTNEQVYVPELCAMLGDTTLD